MRSRRAANDGKEEFFTAADPQQKTVLRLPELDQAKSAVLNSVSSAEAQRGHRHAIDEFVEWYCSEPRLLFNKTVVLRYRIHLESRLLAPGTINLRLGAVRRLAYEAADSGLLSADLAAAIRRVKGVKKLGVRLGNWLTAEQSQRLWQAPDGERLKGKRDRALLAVMLACGVRRHEAVDLEVEHIQQREEHWAIVDLKGKGGHMRTIPMPSWVKQILDDWVNAANVRSGKLFRRVNRTGKAWGDNITEKAVWHIVREYAAKAESTSWHRMTFVGRVPGYVMRREENSNRSSFCLGTYQFKLPSATSAANSEFGPRLTIESGLSRYSNFHSLGFRLADHTTIRLGQTMACRRIGFRNSAGPFGKQVPQSVESPFLLFPVNARRVRLLWLKPRSSKRFACYGFEENVCVPARTEFHNLLSLLKFGCYLAIRYRR